MSEFVNILDELIQEENKRFKNALFGPGDLKIKPGYKNIFVDPINFPNLSSNHKVNYL